MELIDDEGNLLGRINVVDALVVLLVLAVAIAGVVLLLGLSDGEPATRHATLDLGSQPDYVVDELAAGDELETTQHATNVTITDVHATPSGSNESDSDAHLVVRATIAGTEVDNDDQRVFQLGGDPLRAGASLEFTGTDYTVNGQLTQLDASGESLDLASTEVLVESTVSDITASELQPGDTYRVGPHEVANIASVTTYPTGPDTNRALVGLNLTTLTRGEVQTFGSETVSLNSEIPFRTGAYTLTGDVLRLDTTEEAGTSTTVTTELTIDQIEPEQAERITAGLTETQRGETIATITDVAEAPAAVILESEDGDIFRREHPTDLELTLTVDLRVQEVDDDIRFHGESVHEGDELYLDFGTRAIEADLDRIE